MIEFKKNITCFLFKFQYLHFSWLLLNLYQSTSFTVFVNIFVDWCLFILYNNNKIISQLHQLKLTRNDKLKNHKFQKTVRHLIPKETNSIIYDLSLILHRYSPTQTQHYSRSLQFIIKGSHIGVVYWLHAIVDWPSFSA